MIKLHIPRSIVIKSESLAISILCKCIGSDLRTSRDYDLSHSGATKQKSRREKCRLLYESHATINIEQSKATDQSEACKLSSRNLVDAEKGQAANSPAQAQSRCAASPTAARSTVVAPIAAGPTPEEEVQALGADVAEGDGLGS